jgi:hypothetical protein
MRARCAWLTVSLLLGCVSLHAVTTNDPATAEREGRELAQQLRNARPDANFTNSGTLVIRTSKKQRSTVRFDSRVVVTETNWTSFYAATDGTNDLSHFSVEHQVDVPNRYHLNHTNLLDASKSTMSFAGSDFWLADLGLEFFHWPVQLLTRREIKRGESCSVLESRNPSPPPGGYSRIVSWIDNDTGGILLAEAYDARGKLLKEFRPTEFEKVNGEWHLREMEMENVQTGSRSTLIFDLKSP